MVCHQHGSSDCRVCETPLLILSRKCRKWSISHVCCKSSIGVQLKDKLHSRYVKCVKENATSNVKCVKENATTVFWREFQAIQICHKPLLWWQGNSAVIDAPRLWNTFAVETGLLSAILKENAKVSYKIIKFICLRESVPMFRWLICENLTLKIHVPFDITSVSQLVPCSV